MVNVIVKLKMLYIIIYFSVSICIWFMRIKFIHSFMDNSLVTATDKASMYSIEIHDIKHSIQNLASHKPQSYHHAFFSMYNHLYNTCI